MVYAALQLPSYPLNHSLPAKCNTKQFKSQAQKSLICTIIPYLSLLKLSKQVIKKESTFSLNFLPS